MPLQLTPQQALIYAMITTAAVDRSLSDEELERISGLVRQLPIFEGLDGDSLALEAQACAKVVSAEDGLKNVLAMITGALPEHLRETAYALAAEVAASDLDIAREEVRFLQLLANALELDKLVCAALERGASARYQSS